MIEHFNALAFARKTLDEHGLTDWKVEWDRAKRRAGQCRHDSKKITLSATLAKIYPPAVMVDVVLHEVAHALAGPKHKHDQHWKRIAVSLGATPKALLPPTLPTPHAPWEGTCAHCGLVKRLHSMPRRVVSCGRCSSSFRSDLVLQWAKNGTPAQPSGTYAKELARITRRTRPPLQ